MGQKASSLAGKVSKSVYSMFSAENTDESQGSLAVTPFVFKRTGSMYFDEDGDLAHEFYVEVSQGRRHYMRRQIHSIIPQGDVDLPHPRLNVDFPVVICEAPT